MLSEEARSVDDLREDSRLGPEEFDKALEKLQIHGGAHVDFGGNVTIGRPAWKKTYSVQAAYRREQFEKVVRFTTSNDCRMSALVRHFGDVEDANRPCGHCDICDPADAVLRQFRRASNRERHWVQDVIETLRASAYKTPKGLRAELAWAESLERDDFEALIGSMLRADLIAVEDAEFEKDGKIIPFRKISLTDAGFDVRATTPLDLLFSDGIVEEFGAAPPAKKKKRPAEAAPPSSPRIAAQAPVPSASAKRSRANERAPIELTGDSADLASRLKDWRAAEAKRLGVPAYLVLHDRTLNALAAARPSTPHELLAVEGMGPSKVGRFGEAILDVCGSR
jgi:superfamily II DNA helicase RecQ